MQIKQTDRMSLTLSKLGTICFHSCASSVLFVLRLVLPSGHTFWPQGYKTFFMLNSVVHEIFPAHKC